MHYCDEKQIILFANSVTSRALILKTKLIIEEKKRIIKMRKDINLT
jgi:hypothetical protein